MSMMGFFSAPSLSLPKRTQDKRKTSKLCNATRKSYPTGLGVLIHPSKSTRFYNFLSCPTGSLFGFRCAPGSDSRSTATCQRCPWQSPCCTSSRRRPPR